MRYTWIIDAGHGGLIDGQYVTAPDKMYEHSPHEIFYEGVFNRQIKDALLKDAYHENLVTIDLCPTELDIPLRTRAAVANLYDLKYPNCVGISLHSNASPQHNGTGFEIHTGPGETRSDVFARIAGEIIMKNFPGIAYRKGDAPGELDKDSHFYILKATNCPWILPECLFFDNYKDYLLLLDADFRIEYVKSLIEFMKRAENENI